MLLWRLGLRLSNRSVSFSLMKPAPGFSTFFSANRARFGWDLFDSAKPRLRLAFSNYLKVQKRRYATFSELGYSAKGGPRRPPNFNNFTNNIVKPTLFTLAFSAGTYFVVPYLFDNTPMRYFKQNPMHLLYGLIGINCAVFGLWQLRYNSSALYRLLEQYFLMDRNSLTRKSNWSMVLSTFSHQEFFHLLINMGCLYSFSLTMLSVMGVANFTSIYLISGCVSSLASMVFSFLTRSYGCSLGASGAISAIFAGFAALFPTASVAFFVFPIPGGASTALALFTAYNVGGCIFKWSTFDFAAHLGGTVVGYLWGLYYKEKIKSRYGRSRGGRRYSW
ncbi:DEKNAAE102219 [Brettanomyces naardenensis]|uniref:DEKNAAE102219 n=2 Tax=Brettanomyces naardenensis TaxID=13370 RepID=A0A448YKI8_BRENA|nr:DEKNAAE102219 [Brettanomyces naardenensis]